MCARISTMSDKKLRETLIKLAYEKPELRPDIIPLVKIAAWENLPKGWTEDSVKKFWGDLTGDNNHKITKCISEMTGKVDDPGAFCGGLASRLGER